MYDCIYSILFYYLTLFYPIHLETFLLRSSEQCRVVRRVKRKEKKKRARKGNGAGDSLSRRTRFAYYGDIALRARGAVFAYRYIFFLRSTRAKLSSLSLALFLGVLRGQCNEIRSYPIRSARSELPV